MRTIWIVALLALSGCAAHSHLLGAVEDQTNAQPIAGAVLRLEGTGTRVETDSSGEYEIDAVSKSAPYVLSITASGYEELREEIVFEGHEVWRDFQLAPVGQTPQSQPTKPKAPQRKHPHEH